MGDILANGMAQTATDKAFRRLDAIFADYLIHQACNGRALGRSLSPSNGLPIVSCVQKRRRTWNG
jgi:hypothetical protein